MNASVAAWLVYLGHERCFTYDEAVYSNFPVDILFTLKKCGVLGQTQAGTLYITRKGWQLIEEAYGVEEH